MTNSTKRCARCEQTKNTSSFTKNRSRKDGLDSYCRTCKKGIRDDKKQKEYQLEYQKAYRQSERGQEIRKRAMDDWNLSNKENYIYQIRNVITGKVYIGSTQRTHQSRWSKHLSRLRSNGHCNPLLQSEFNQFDETDFQFEVIKTVPKDMGKEFLLEEERKAIHLASDRCYNIYNLFQH